MVDKPDLIDRVAERCWISVNDELPKIHSRDDEPFLMTSGLLLVCIKNKHNKKRCVATDVWNGHKWILHSSKDNDWVVTYWMELPKQPKDESDGGTSDD